MLPRIHKKKFGIAEFSVKYIFKLHLVLHVDLFTYIEVYEMCSSLDQLCCQWILVWIPGIIFVTASSAEEGGLGLEWLPVGCCPNAPVDARLPRW